MDPQEDDRPVRRLPACPRLHPFRIAALWVLAVLILLGASSVAVGALYVYDIRSTELLMDEKQTELKIGYGPRLMVMDANVRYTGGWMQRLFGEVKQERHTTLIVLDQDQVREISWENWTVTVLPLDRLRDAAWVREKTSPEPEAEGHLSGRYQPVEPVLSVEEHPHAEHVDGYACRKVEAKLRLETRDTRRNATSVTHVKQVLWLTEDVAGYADRREAHRELASKLGLDAGRIGSLSFILRYWPGSLEPVRELVDRARGVFVKSLLTVDAEYTSGIGSNAPRTTTRRLKEELIQLKSVGSDPLDRSVFDAPPQFRTVVLE